MAGHREHRKAIPGHKPGTPWDPEEWAAFKSWALQNGAEFKDEDDLYEEISWMVNGRLHRDDGPAIVFSDGTEWWYQNDKEHRSDGPAVVWPYGNEEWYQNGKLHRLDGPAIIYPDGHEERWFKEGVEYTDGTFAEIMKSQW